MLNTCILYVVTVMDLFYAAARECLYLHVVTCNVTRRVFVQCRTVVACCTQRNRVKQLCVEIMLRCRVLGLQRDIRFSTEFRPWLIYPPR